MSYISKVLCHFVGRSKKSDEERFDLLCQIIKEKQLKANLDTPDNPSLQTNGAYKGDHLGEVFEKIDCVCFCDIPDDMLEIHTLKYSKFGMGFSKTFLTQQGARPVTYVPVHTCIKEPAQTNTPKSTSSEYFLYINKLAVYFNSIISLLNQAAPFKNQLALIVATNPDLVNYIKLLDGKIVQNVLDGKAQEMLFSEMSAFCTQCAYIKLFDETLPEDDPENYYMEREWRSINSVDFSLKDIEKTYLPDANYQDKFLNEFPEYSGEFVIFD